MESLVNQYLHLNKTLQESISRIVTSKNDDKALEVVNTLRPTP